MMLAATMAGVGFGSAGVHIPHACAYPIAGLKHVYEPPGYESDHPFVPHGISVIVTAPAAFRFTYSASTGASRAGGVAAGLVGDGAGRVAERPACLDDRSRRSHALGARLRRVRHPRPGRGRGRPAAPARRHAARRWPKTTSRRSCARVCTVKSRMGVVPSQAGGEIIRRVPLQNSARRKLQGHTSDARIAAIAARQHALITIVQLLALGLDASAVIRRVARGTLHRRYRGVYVVGQPKLSPEGECWPRPSPPGRGAALSHRSAGKLHGISRFHPPRIAVVTTTKRRPEGRRGAPRPLARPARRHDATRASP